MIGATISHCGRQYEVAVADGGVGVAGEEAGVVPVRYEPRKHQRAGPHEDLEQMQREQQEDDAAHQQVGVPQRRMCEDRVARVCDT